MNEPSKEAMKAAEECCEGVLDESAMAHIIQSSAIDAARKEDAAKVEVRWSVKPNGEHSSNIDYLERDDHFNFSTVTDVADELNRLIDARKEDAETIERLTTERDGARKDSVTGWNIASDWKREVESLRTQLAEAQTKKGPK